MKVDRFTKIVVLLNCIVPVTLLGWDAWEGELGANPVNFAIRTTGVLSLLFLMLTLAVTPVSRITGYGWLGQFRRLGLNAFFHTSLHFFLFYGFDRGASIGETLSEILMRPYLMVGSVGLILMVPLALTSTNGMIKRLGQSRWKALHRLTYVAASRGCPALLYARQGGHYSPRCVRSRSGIALSIPTGRPLLATAYGCAEISVRPTSRTADTFEVMDWAASSQVFDETPNIRTFRLMSAGEPRLPFDFLPGQYLNLTLVIDGQKFVAPTRSRQHQVEPAIAS